LVNNGRNRGAMRLVSNSRYDWPIMDGIGELMWLVNNGRNRSAKRLVNNGRNRVAIWLAHNGKKSKVGAKRSGIGALIWLVQ
jgi:hypothetical protein